MIGLIIEKFNSLQQIQNFIEKLIDASSVKFNLNGNEIQDFAICLISKLVVNKKNCFTIKLTNLNNNKLKESKPLASK